VFAAGRDSDPEIDVDEDAFFHVRFTSGTTGKPKGIAATNRAITTMHLYVALELEYSPLDVALVNAPLAHASFHIAAGTVAVGGTIVLQRSFDPSTVWLACDEHRVTHAFMVPTMFALAVDQPGSGSSIRQFLSMASAFPLALKEKMAERFPQADLFEMYGATELGLCTVLRPEDSHAKGHTVGRPAFGYRVRVLDPDGAEVPAGEIGEIYVQGPSTCHGYVGSVPPSPTAVRDGWLSVGDLGSLDADGFLRVADRRSDLIISGGLNVYPAEVEDTLMRAAGVREVAVIGVPDPVWGQQVVAVLVGSADAEALTAHCRAALAGYKVPRRIEFVDELPKNATGKVLRRELREQYGGVA
jgi:acyl-CoA synthetase (AMP-forming)/AMP-acid ligase II